VVPMVVATVLASDKGVDFNTFEFNKSEDVDKTSKSLPKATHHQYVHRFNEFVLLNQVLTVSSSIQARAHILHASTLLWVVP
jgi:hypothetical protein